MAVENLPTFPNPPYMNFGGLAHSSDFGTVIPQSSRVIYLRSGGDPTGGIGGLGQRIVTTLAASLRECRAGLGDVIAVLPGHAENVTDATMLDNLVSGTRVIGLGNVMQSNAPAFTFAAAAAQWIVNDADFSLENVVLNLDGANTVAKAIVVTAGGFRMSGCRVRTASSVSLDCVIALELGAAAHKASVIGNYIHGTADASVSAVQIKVVAAIDDLTILGNRINAAATAASGNIQIGAVACLRLLISGNEIFNSEPVSAACISLGAAASTGTISYNTLGILADATPPVPVVYGAGTLTRAYQNFCADQDNLSGMLRPAVVL